VVLKKKTEHESNGDLIRRET